MLTNIFLEHLSEGAILGVSFLCKIIRHLCELLPGHVAHKYRGRTSAVREPQSYLELLVRANTGETSQTYVIARRICLSKNLAGFESRILYIEAGRLQSVYITRHWYCHMSEKKPSNSEELQIPFGDFAQAPTSQSVVEFRDPSRWRTKPDPQKIVHVTSSSSQAQLHVGSQPSQNT